MLFSLQEPPHPPKALIIASSMVLLNGSQHSLQGSQACSQIIGYLVAPHGGLQPQVFSRLPFPQVPIHHSHLLHPF